MKSLPSSAIRVREHSHHSNGIGGAPSISALHEARDAIKRVRTAGIDPLAPAQPRAPS